jgi:hypothetical protein
MGTFSQKIHCQAIPWTMAPPTSGPKATARPLMPPQAPRARPRFAAGTALERMVSVSGITIAPPSPWTAHRPHRALKLVAPGPAAPTLRLVDTALTVPFTDATC